MRLVEKSRRIRKYFQSVMFPQKLRYTAMIADIVVFDWCEHACIPEISQICFSVERVFASQAKEMVASWYPILQYERLALDPDACNLNTSAA